MVDALDAITGEARRIAAIHEAGHAVAACMRGGSSLRSVRLGDVPGTGITYHRSKPCDEPFIAWAGCWAEARLAWGDLPYDATDDEGYEWCDHLTGVFLNQPDHIPRIDQLGPGTENCWCREVDVAWPVVQTVAERLLAGAWVNHDLVVELLDRRLDELQAEGVPR